MARLTAYVHLIHPVSGVLATLAPGDDLPDWAEGQVTNQAVLDQSASPRPVDDVVDAKPAPPRSGAGSGVAAWRAYATDVLGIEVPDDASRDDIVELVDASAKTHADLS